MDKKLFHTLFFLLGIENYKLNLDHLDISDSDWNDILQLSFVQGVTPILYYNLKSSHLSIHVPQYIKDKLKSIYLTNTAKNMKLYNELFKIISILNKENIPVIITKGIALAEFIYKDIALRPMSDIDLIVERKNVFNLNKVLSDLGYESNISNLLSKKHAQWTMHVVYTKDIFSIEAHSGTIFEIPSVDPWSKADLAKISSEQVYVLGKEDLLLHLCSHLNRHLYLDKYTRLIWWFDIAKVLEKYGGSIDWSYVLYVAKKNKIERSIRKILNIVNSDFKCDIPEFIINEGNNYSSFSLIDILSYLKEASSDRDFGPRDRDIDAISTSISRIPSLHNKIYHIFRRLFPSRNYIARYLSKESSKKIYLYYPLYIVKVILKSFKALGQISKYKESRYDFFTQLDALKMKNNAKL